MDTVKINPTAPVVDSFLEVAPYVADPKGRFRTGEAHKWMCNHLGAPAGTASVAIFRWSDPTGTMGLRRLRTTPRFNAMEPVEPEQTNPLSGTKAVEGWAEYKTMVKPKGRPKKKPVQVVGDGLGEVIGREEGLRRLEEYAREPHWEDDPGPDLAAVIERLPTAIKAGISNITVKTDPSWTSALALGAAALALGIIVGVYWIVPLMPYVAR